MKSLKGFRSLYLECVFRRTLWEEEPINDQIEQGIKESMTKTRIYLKPKMMVQSFRSSIFRFEVLNKLQRGLLINGVD